MALTLKKLEAMTDYQLSSVVLRSIAINKALTNWFPVSHCKSKAGIETVESADYHVRYFDINDPSDMWPLIFEFLIETAPLANITKWKAVAVHYNKRGVPISFTAHHTNPLRAAAIVYILIMQEKDNE